MTTVTRNRIFYFLHDTDDVRRPKNLPDPF